MAKKATLSTISTGYNSLATLNANLAAINDKLDNTVSRDGSSPNAMEADLDLNSNDLINAKGVWSQDFYLKGQRIVPTTAAIGVTVTPFDFGGVGDGETDDLAAINSALDYISQNLPDAAGASPMYLDLMGRAWLCSDTVDASGLTLGRNWGIRNGSILGRHASGAVLDISACRFGHFENLYIEGGSQFGGKPETGILMCRTQDGTRDGRTVNACSVLHFNNVNVDGYFTVAAWFVGGAEEITAVGSRFYNREPTGYAGVIDREVTKTVQLARFTRVTSATSTTVSNYFGCNFQKPFGIAGPCLYTSGGDSQRFYGGYWTCGSGSILEWRCTDAQEDYSWTIETQVETTGTEDFIEFIASGTNPDATIKNLNINLGNMYTKNSIFKMTGWGSGVLTIEDSTIKIPRFAVTGSAWVTATAYVAGDTVTESGIVYNCLVNHTSGTFATDQAAGKWRRSPTFAVNGSNLNLKNTDVYVPDSAILTPTALNGFTGWYKANDLSAPRYYGELWNHTGGITSLYGHYKTERQVSIADDDVEIITLSDDGIASQGYFMFWGVQNFAVQLYYRATSSATAVAGINSNVTVVTNTALAGTTGTDTEVTVAVNDGEVRIENRSGAALQARWVFLAS